ncbi:MAG: BatD family protein [Bacteroidaceae bacterium]|nr:BatD family protein [Bacteroidaceae bacterium]
MKRFLYLLIFLTVATVSHAQTFKASAPDQVVEGENFRVQYVVTDGEPSSFRGPKFDSEGFELLAGPYTSSYSSYQMVNGKTSSTSSVTYTYTLCATKKGKFTIPAASVSVGGKTLTSNTLTISVAQGSGNSGAASGGNRRNQAQSAEHNTQDAGNSISGKDLYMTATASKTKVHEQEAILLTYQVYYTVNLTSLKPNMPDLKGFHVQEVPLPRTKEPKQVTVGGRTYNNVLWSQYVVFPQQTGKLVIPEVTFEATVAQRVRSLDPWDAFFNSGSAYSEVTKNLKTPSITINVEPLPTKPANYSGAVGKFSMKSELTPKQIKTGEALTLKLTVSGVGNMKLIKTPDVNVPKDFEVYDPKVTDNTEITRNGMEGSKTFEYVYVPRNPGHYTIPPVEFCYYDLESNSYKVLQSESFELNIEKGKNSGNGGVSSYANKEDVEELNSDIHYIKMGDVKLQKDESDTFFGSLSYVLEYLIPFILFAILVFIFRKQAIANANVVQMKIKKANKMARKRLRTAKKLMEENKKEAFYDEIMRALYGYVSDKLSIPVAQLNKDNIREKLEEKNLDADLTNRVIQALDECEFARFAPADSSNTLEKFYEQVITLIEQVENSIKK